MKFREKKVEFLPGAKLVMYTEEDQEFTVCAAKSRMTLQGDLEFTTQDELEIFAETIARAWQHHQALKGENGISVESERRSGLLQS